MNTLNALKVVTFSLGISLSSQVQAQINTSNNQLHQSLSGSCSPESIDFSSYSESYIIKDEDTFSDIAATRGIRYSDFLLYLQEFNPGINIDVIRPGESYQILSSKITQNQIDENRRSLEYRQYIERINRLWDEGKTQELERLIGFDITPSLPVNLGLRRFHEVTASMLEQGYSSTARSALPRIEHAAVCKNTLTQYVYASLGFNSGGIIDEYGEILTREGGAWLFPGFLEDSEIFARRNELDLRENFNRNFGKGGNAILDDRESDYSEGLLGMLAFLDGENAIGSYVPTLFHYTGYAAIARDESGGRDINSHIFLNHGSGNTEDFDISKYGLIDNLSGDIRPSLISLVRDQGGKYFDAPSNQRLLSALSKVHEHIGIELKDRQGLYLALEFDKDLNISNLDSIDLSQVVGFRLTGSVVSDGLQISQGTQGLEYVSQEEIDIGGETVIRNVIKDAGDVKIIEHRLLLDWIVLGVGHHVDIFHPTSLLSPSSELLDATDEGVEGHISRQIPIKRFFDITREEVFSGNGNARHVYLDELSLEVFGVKYSALRDPNEKNEIDNLYQIHSMGLQILGYHSFGGKNWNAGSTDVNAPIPLLNIFSNEDIDSLEELYNTYIDEKRVEYTNAIEEECNSGNHENYPFFYIKVFPGDTSSHLWNALGLYVNQHNGYAGGLMDDMLEYQKQILITEIFGTEIGEGNIITGESIFLNARDTIEKIIQVVNEEFVGPDYMAMLSSHDRAIINSISKNGQYLQSLSYFLIKEGYVPATYYQLDDGSLRDMMENFFSRLKRKDIKRYFAFADENGWLDGIQDQIIKIEENRGVDEEKSSIENFLQMLPSSGPNSWGDLQMRLANLLQTDSMLVLWPTRGNLNEAIDLVLSPTSGFRAIIEEYSEKYPEIYSRDVALLESVLSELDSVEPNGELIYELLTQVLRLNDESNQNIIGKIISLSLNNDLYSDTLGHLCEQLRRSGDSCSLLSGENLERFLSYSYLSMNKGTGVSLSILTENYLLRVFESINTQYPDISIPNTEIKESGGLNNRPVLNYFQFRNRIEQYILHYEEYADQNSDVQNLLTELQEFLESSEDRSTKHYVLLSDPLLKNILSESHMDDSMLPTLEEINTNHGVRSIFFSYNAQRHIQGFIVEPEQSPSDFTAPFLLFMLYGQTVGAMISTGVGNIFKVSINGSHATISFVSDIIRRRFKKYKNDRVKNKENILHGKIKREFNTFIGSFKNPEFFEKIDQYIQENKKSNEGNNEVLSNIDGGSVAINYLDGFYKIGEEGIEEFKAGKKYTGGILSNLPNSGIENDYEDGLYVTRYTGIIKDGILQTILVKRGDIKEEKNEETGLRIAAE